MVAVKDHLGNVYNSIKELCQAYNIKENTYYVRLKRGWTLEETLTGDRKIQPHTQTTVYTDHLGNTFNTIKEMCQFHHTDVTSFANRRKKGLPLEECLKTMEVQDYKGNTFPNVKEMCKAYGISTFKYYYGIKNGYSLERILNPKRERISKKQQKEDD